MTPMIITIGGVIIASEPPQLVIGCAPVSCGRDLFRRPASGRRQLAAARDLSALRIVVGVVGVVGGGVVVAVVVVVVVAVGGGGGADGRRVVIGGGNLFANTGTRAPSRAIQESRPKKAEPRRGPN